MARLLLLSAALASASALYDASDDVLQLTQATFDKTGAWRASNPRTRELFRLAQP